MAVGSGIVETGAGAGGGAVALAESGRVAPVDATLAPPAPPPRPATCVGCGIAKPVGTTIDGVPVMFVTEVFSRGVRITSCSVKRSHHCLQSFVRARCAFT